MKKPGRGGTGEHLHVIVVPRSYTCNKIAQHYTYTRFNWWHLNKLFGLHQCPSPRDDFVL